MAQAQGSYGRIVIADELTFKSVPELPIEDCEDAWNEQSGTGVTAEVDAVDFKVGSGAAKFTMTTETGVEIIASEVISIASLASYQRITAWVKSSINLAAGDVQLLLDEHAMCASPLETLNIPALVANTWTHISIDLANPATDLLLTSIGLKQAVDKGAFIFQIDDIRAVKSGLYTPFNSESFRLSRNLYSSNAIRSTRNPNMPARGNYDVAGDITMELNPYVGRLLYHLFGGYAKTGSSSPFTHKFTIGVLPTGMQIEKQFSDIGQYLRYNGVKINSLKVDVKAEGIIQAVFSMMGAKETVATQAHDGNPWDFGHTPFDGFEAVINQGGSPLAVVTEANFTMTNNLDGSTYVIGGGGERNSIPAGIVKVEGQVTALFADMTLYNLAIAHTETSLQIALTKGDGGGTAGNEKLTFNMDEIIFKPQAPVISGPTGVLIELPFEAYYNNDADASALWVELKNAQGNL